MNTSHTAVLIAATAGLLTMSAGVAMAADGQGGSTQGPPSTGTSGWSNGTGDHESADVQGSQGGDGKLPFTGAPTGLLGGLGLTALAAGGALTVAGRRRPTAAPAVPKPRVSPDALRR